MLRTLVLPVLLSPFLLTLGCGASDPPKPPVPPPPVVPVSQVLRKVVSDYEDFSGRTESLRTVELRARVTGYLDQLHFEDGQDVRKGQLLFQVDPLPLRATLNQTEANLRLAIAHRQRLEADFHRAEGLLRRRAISQEEYDKIVGDRDEAEAAVGVARANRKLARINLDYAQVRAPFDGRISRRMIDCGNLVKADETPLTTIVSLDKMYVYFDVDERTLLRLRKEVRKGKIPTTRDNKSPILLGLADEKGYSRQGIIDFEDNRLDVGTGTYRMRAVVDNADRLLSPGLYVRVRLPVGKPHRALLISEQALAPDQDKKYIYVVNKIESKGKTQYHVQYCEVEVGRLHDGLREITRGLKRGQFVVVSGLQRIRQNAEIVPEIVDMPMVGAKAKDKMKLKSSAKNSR